VTAGEDGTAPVANGGMDELLAMNCYWVRDYLNNPSVTDLSDSDRQLCDGIRPPSSHQKSSERQTETRTQVLCPRSPPNNLKTYLCTLYNIAC
jgi:hypothetical protein